MSTEVYDSLSNTNEHIEQAAKAIGRGKIRRKVFEAIYHHKAKVKTVADIAKRAHLKRMVVLQNGRFLVTKGIVKAAKRDGDTAYEKIDFFHAHKAQILNLAGNSKKLNSLPTKRKIVVKTANVVSIRQFGSRALKITIDDIREFEKTARVAGSEYMPATVSETQFKNGIQSIVGEPGVFKDWGGERSDLYTSRLHIKSKRLSAAFAFKGPGLKSKLVFGKMGKNGDQLIRLFGEDADIFFVQHWREIDPSIIEAMHSFATAKAVMTGRSIYYGTIDGKDSHRLFLAYPAQFERALKGKKKRIRG